MKDPQAESQRWIRQAANGLDFARLGLREGFYAQTCFQTQQAAHYYIPSRYPNGIPAGSPFEVFPQSQATEAVAGVERLLTDVQSLLAAAFAPGGGEN